MDTESRQLTGGYNCPPVPKCRQDNDCLTNIFGRCHQTAAVGQWLMVCAILLLMADTLFPMYSFVERNCNRTRRRRREEVSPMPWLSRCCSPKVQSTLGLACNLVTLVSAVILLSPSFDLMRGEDVEQEILENSVKTCGYLVMGGALFSSVFSTKALNSTKEGKTIAKVVLELSFGFAPSSFVSLADMKPTRMRILADNSTQNNSQIRSRLRWFSGLICYSAVHLLQALYFLVLAVFSLKTGSCHHSERLSFSLTIISLVRLCQFVFGCIGVYNMALGSSPFLAKLQSFANVPCVIIIIFFTRPLFEELVYFEDAIEGAPLSIADGETACVSTQTICLLNLVWIAAPAFLGFVYFCRLLIQSLCSKVLPCENTTNSTRTSLVLRGSSQDVLRLLEIWSSRKTKTVTEAENLEDWECSICLEHGDVKSCQDLPCGHCFHYVCIERAFMLRGFTCPLCRDDTALRLMASLVSPSSERDAGHKKKTSVLEEQQEIEMT